MKTTPRRLAIAASILTAAATLQACRTAGTSQSPVDLGDGKILGTIPAQQALALLPLIAAATGNPNAAQLATLLGSAQPAQTAAASQPEWIAIGDDGNLKVPETLLSIYTRLTPASQAQAIALFVAYQKGERIPLKPNLPLAEEIVAIVKTESPSLGALAHWALHAYINKTESPIQHSVPVTPSWSAR